MNKKWAEYPILGCLYVEIVLIRFDIPLLFVCNTESNIRYLTLCINEETNEFLLAECSSDTLLELVNGNQSIDSIFQTAKNLFLVDYRNSECKSLSIEEVSEDMLPDKDTFFTIKNLSIDKYIEILKNECKNLNNIGMDTSFARKYSNIYEYTDTLRSEIKIPITEIRYNIDNNLHLNFSIINRKEYIDSIAVEYNTISAIQYDKNVPCYKIDKLKNNCAIEKGVVGAA